MAHKSAVVMPLNACCLTKIIQLPSEEDVGQNVRYCRECGTYITFDENRNAWREYDDNIEADWRGLVNWWDNKKCFD